MERYLEKEREEGENEFLAHRYGRIEEVAAARQV
jgi:hypothetical protein